MKIGFEMGFNNKEEKRVDAVVETCITPKKSIVQVYFPARAASYAYYNDMFDLKVGDKVYVEGKLEGYLGTVVLVNYNFKIRLSDYKKVIGVVDKEIKGEIYFSNSHVFAFDRATMPYEKIITWFMKPKNEDEIVCGYDDTELSLEDLSEMNISEDVAKIGYEYYNENKVVYICVDNGVGKAIVLGEKAYEIEFELRENRISKLVCSCYCAGECKHEFAVLLQLRDCVKSLENEFGDVYNGYFAALCKDAFAENVLIKKGSGKVEL